MALYPSMCGCDERRPASSASQSSSESDFHYFISYHIKDDACRCTGSSAMIVILLHLILSLTGVLCDFALAMDDGKGHATDAHK